MGDPSDVLSTGIPALGAVGWGAHICQLFREQRDLAETLVPYFREGLHNRERCLWVTSDPLGTDHARDLLRAAVPDVAARERRGQLRIVDGRQWYRALREANPSHALEQWLRFAYEGLDQGFAGLRLTGNTTWLDPAERKEFIRTYEPLVHDAFGKHRVAALCTYRAADCSPEETLELCTSHEIMLTRRDGRSHTVPGCSRRPSGEQLAAKVMGIASHELRTPLNGINLTVESLRRVRDLRRLGPLVERLERCGQHMARLVGDFESFAHSSLGNGLSLRPAPVDLEALCRVVVDELWQQHPRRDVRFEVRGETRGHWDADRLQQVVANLVNNALRHGEDPVRLELGGDAEVQRLRCHNHGPPIPSHRLGRIFEPFDDRGALPKSRRGLGLGLYIVQELVRAHGGTVSISSGEQEGTSVEVTLPRRGSDASTR